MQMLALITLAALLCTSGVVGENGLTRARSVSSFESSVSRHLLTIPSIDDVRASCKTKASTSLSLTHGRARVKSRSTCAAFAGSIGNIEEIVEDYIENVKIDAPKTCTTVKIKEVIQTCAQAISRVYTEAAVDIRIRGDARACASATSEGDAYAKAYAALLINLWLGSTTGENSAEAEAKATTLTFTLSKAWAKAKVARCRKGTGRVKGFESSFASQVRVAITCVTVELATQLCDAAIKKQIDTGKCGECSNGELQGLLKATESTSEINVCSSTFDLENIKRGEADTEDRKPVKCSGKKEKCCGDFYNGASECVCGRKCSMKRTVSGVWMHTYSKKLCYCPNYDALPFDKPSRD